MRLVNKVFTAFLSASQEQPESVKRRERWMPHRSQLESGKQSYKLRSKYHFRFFFRLAVFLGMAALYFFHPQTFEAAEGMNFFKRFSVLHLIWLYWMIDALLPLFPTTGMISIGALKHMQRLYIPQGKIQTDRLIAYMKRSTKDSLKVFCIWVIYMLGLLVLYLFGWLRTKEFVCICAFLHVVDIFFILVWCPFRALFMKNRCCTTCRIFNWDHILIFSALFFVPGFFGYSLIFASALTFVIWELCFFLHPERFWEGTNCTLRCENCRDKICPHARYHAKDKQDDFEKRKARSDC